MNIEKNTDERYLRLLSEKFPNAQSVVSELINLRAILSLPKGTEHFVSDLHGESSAFIHMIKNASGVVRRKVDEVYGDRLSEEEKRALCALIYYPDERIELIKKYYSNVRRERLMYEETSPQGSSTTVHWTLDRAELFTPQEREKMAKVAVSRKSYINRAADHRNDEEYKSLFRLNAQISNLPTLRDWYVRRLNQVVDIARAVTIKYSRSKVHKMLPADYAYVISELLHESSLEQKDRQTYYNAIIEAIIETGCADQLLIAISYLIHGLTIDTLHIVGDIFDRGPAPHKILDVLSTVRDYDIQWGNHDIEWMGAMAGNMALLATVLRVSIRYANIETLEEGYGINLLPLANFAMTIYGDDPCTIWQTKDFENNPRLTRSAQLMAKMHKAISIIQFKLEGQTVLRHPEWQMDHRALLDKIDLKNGTIQLPITNHQSPIATYKLLDTNLPTIDPEHPYELNQYEQDLMNQLWRSFRKSEKMQRHLRMLYEHGSLYLVRNGFLLYHAAIPLNADGSFTETDVCGQRVSGKALMDRTDEIIRQAFYGEGKAKQDALDYMLYLWEGENSPLYNKDKMTTLERYFLADKDTWTEKKGAYFTLADDKKVCENILKEFGLDPATGRIINGHVPVRTIKGETPIRADGKRFVIDGGFSKPYQEKTGIAGYTLIYNSHGIQLVEHESFESREQAVLSGSDIHSRALLQDFSGHRIRIKDTDKGKELLRQLESLEQLLHAYKTGTLRER
ncbi:MAG: fructose-1,6-bisphosphatase [Paludibacteraceae bacterium]|nr:fructose-1,6-bisphosphatase [Paludibacteraceae bacterium]